MKYILLDATQVGINWENGIVTMGIQVTIGIEGEMHDFKKVDNFSKEFDGSMSFNEFYKNQDGFLKKYAQEYIDANYNN